MRYNPDQHIDPEDWESHDEGEKIEAVRAYHRRQRIPLSNDRIHATFPMAAENQVAMGDRHPAEAVLCRLMREGLNRHEAVHAIASVVARHVYRALQHEAEADLAATYKDELVSLTAESWLKQGS